MVVERFEFDQEKHKKRTEKSVEEDHEQQLWTNLPAASWETSITSGFFRSLYADTCWYLFRLLKEYKLNTMMEVGCGTGQIIEATSNMVDTSGNVEFIGLDINPKFIKHCQKISSGRVAFHVADGTKLTAWSTIMLKPRERKTLVCCVNNTLSIMPEEIRPRIVHQMRAVAGPDGLVFLSYWNGRKFRDGLMQYYRKNPQLCGDFEIAEQDFERRKLMTSTGYTSHWPLEYEVESMLRCYGVPIKDILEVKVVGNGIFATLRGCKANTVSML